MPDLNEMFRSLHRQAYGGKEPVEGDPTTELDSVGVGESVTETNEEHKTEKTKEEEKVIEPSTDEPDFVDEDEEGYTEDEDEDEDGIAKRSAYLTELERAKSELRELRSQVQQMQAGRSGGQPEQKKYTPLQFIKDEEEYEAIMASKEGLNAFANRLFYTAYERALQDLPNVVDSHVDVAFGRQALVADFYDRNPELRPHREYLRFVTQQVEVENPNLEPAAILKEVENRAYKTLRLKRPNAGKVRTPEKKRPAFVKGTGSRTPQKGGRQGSLRAELDMMM